MSNRKFTTRTTELTVMPDGEPLFSEQATKIRITDEGAGEFLEISQEESQIKIDPDEWPGIKNAIEEMIGVILANQQPKGAK